MTTVISSGQTQKVPSGGHANGVILRGGHQIVSGGGTTAGTVISHGGQEIILSSALANRTTVSAGGVADVRSGGFVTNANILNGGKIFVAGIGSKTKIASGGFEEVRSGGEVVSTTIAGGGRLVVDFQATAYATRVSSGGTQQMLSHCNVYGTTVLSGGTLIDGPESFVFNSVIGRGGTLNMIQNASFGGTISAGAIVNLQKGDFLNAPIVSKGVKYTIDAHASAEDITIATGGVLTVVGTAGVTMSANARLVVSGGSVGVSATTGDRVSAISGGRVYATVQAGATVTVTSGATIAGGQLEGGFINVASGARFTDGVHMDSGTYEVHGGTLGFTLREFGSAANLDLASFAFRPAETLTYVTNNPEHGTLTITDGADKATITVLTNFSHYVAAGFHMASNHAGGTIITYTPPTSGSAVADLAGHH